MSESDTTCTCGRCYEGWLSPRMKERLEYSTELRYRLSQSLLDTQDGVPDDVTSVLPIDYARIDTAVHYLPPAVRAKIGPSASSETGDAPSGDAVYRGYIAVFKAIYDLVNDDDAEDKGFPTVSTVSDQLAKLRKGSDESSEHLGVYLDNDGDVEFALDCIVDCALQELSPLGRMYDAEKQYIDSILESQDGHAECHNDLNFALVRTKLGLPANTSVVIPEDEEDFVDPLSDDE